MGGIASIPACHVLYLCIDTGCSLIIVFIPENVVIFLISANAAATLVFYLPGVCTHTRQVEHQRCSRTGRVQKNHNIFRNKHTIQWIPCMSHFFLFYKAMKDQFDFALAWPRLDNIQKKNVHHHNHHINPALSLGLIHSLLLHLVKKIEF